MDVLCGAQVYYTDIETYHNKFLKRTLRVKSSTNTCLLYMETGRFPLSVFINMCIVKFWLKILKTCDAKLISVAYAKMIADDLSLLCPSFTGTKEMLKTCEDYAMKHNILFNDKKSQMLTFDHKSRILVKPILKMKN